MPGTAAPRPAPRSGTARYLAVALMLVMALLAACGDDGGNNTADGNAVDGGNSPAEPSSDANSDGAASGDASSEESSGGSGDGADQPVTSGGDPTGTVEIDGEVHQLSADPDNPYLQCAITDQGAQVTGLVSPEGIEVTVSGASVWGASVSEEGRTWEAASDDPSLNSDATRELSPGRLVIDGTWGDEYSVDTAQIRLEVNC